MWMHGSPLPQQKKSRDSSDSPTTFENSYPIIRVWRPLSSEFESASRGRLTSNTPGKASSCCSRMRQSSPFRTLRFLLKSTLTPVTPASERSGCRAMRGQAAWHTSASWAAPCSQRRQTTQRQRKSSWPSSSPSPAGGTSCWVRTSPCSLITKPLLPCSLLTNSARCARTGLTSSLNSPTSRSFIYPALPTSCLTTSAESSKEGKMRLRHPLQPPLPLLHLPNCSAFRLRTGCFVAKSPLLNARRCLSRPTNSATLAPRRLSSTSGQRRSPGLASATMPSLLFLLVALVSVSTSPRLAFIR